MLSQLHWGHMYGPTPYEDAHRYLQQLVDMRSAKREFFSNLGLLKLTLRGHGG